MNNYNSLFLLNANFWMFILIHLECFTTSQAYDDEQYSPQCQKESMAGCNSCGTVHRSNMATSPICEQPWTVQILVQFETARSSHPETCTGAILNSRYAITAAHCFFKKGKAAHKAAVWVGRSEKAGTTGTTVEEPCGIQSQLLDVEEYVVHPLYKDSGSYLNDVSLLRFKGRVKFSGVLEPICVLDNDVDDIGDGEDLIVTGWQLVSEPDGLFSTSLQAFPIKLIDQKECHRNVFIEHDHSIQNYFCSRIDIGRSIPNEIELYGANSGGLILRKFRTQNRYVLVGLNSYMVDHFSKSLRYTDINIRLSAYVSWIKDIIGVCLNEPFVRQLL